MPLPCREETVTRSGNTYSSRKRESQIALPQTQSAFHRRAQRNASRRRDARQQSDRSPVGINRMASSQRVMFSGAKHAQSSITKTVYQATGEWKDADWMYAGAGSADIPNWARAVVVVEPDIISAVAARAAIQGIATNGLTQKNAFTPKHHAQLPPSPACVAAQRCLALPVPGGSRCCRHRAWGSCLPRRGRRADSR